MSRPPAPPDDPPPAPRKRARTRSAKPVDSPPPAAAAADDATEAARPLAAIVASVDVAAAADGLASADVPRSEPSLDPLPAAAPPAAPSTPPAEPRPGDALAALTERLAALEADLHRGLRFVHVVADRNQRALAGHAALLHGMGDTLARHGALAPGEVAAARDAYLAAAPAPAFRVRLAADVDKYAVEPAILPCAELLPLCKAACCRRPFALGTQDLEEGALRWDVGDPYVNRRHADGCCVHVTGEGACSVWRQRPLRCRRLDCRTDPTIWIDFDRRIPHPELAALQIPRPAGAAAPSDGAPDRDDGARQALASGAGKP